MPVAEAPQHVHALVEANRVRLEAVRQRHELVGSPAKTLIPALIDPTPELASLTLRLLFCRDGERLIRRFNKAALRRAMADVGLQRPHGRRLLHEDLRLRDLTHSERECLIRAVVKRAPKAWREAQ